MMKKQWRELIYKLMYLVAFCAVVGWLLSTHFKAESYKDDISTRDSVINAANQRNGVLEIELQVLETSLLISEAEIAGYEGSIDSLKQKRIEDKIKYEEEIANIIHIPADSLYRLVTGRLN